MSRKLALPLLACLAALSCPTASLAAPAGASAEQIAWVRRAATNFVTAELAGNGAGACGVLEGRLRSTQHGRTCEQRWDARIARQLHVPGARAQLRAQLRAIAHNRVSVHGDVATLALPTPLMDGVSRLVWTEMCWMVTG